MRGTHLSNKDTLLCSNKFQKKYGFQKTKLVNANDPQFIANLLLVLPTCKNFQITANTKDNKVMEAESNLVEKDFKTSSVERFQI